MKKQFQKGEGVADEHRPLTTPVAVAPSLPTVGDQAASIANAPSRIPREIKFRAWDGERMLFRELHDRNWYTGPEQRAKCVREALPNDAHWMKVMQFTGVRDTECREIYEGDIVTFTYWWFDGAGHADSQLTGDVVYIENQMSFGLHGVKNREWLRHIGGEGHDTPDTAPFALWMFDEADFAVVGNIHEHPELLRVSGSEGLVRAEGGAAETERSEPVDTRPERREGDAQPNPMIP